MLSLASRFELGEFALFRDRTAAAADPRTSRFYAVRTSPRLAQTAEGEPQFEFIWFRRAAATGEHGGMLLITTEIGPSPEERVELAAEIERELGAELSAPAEVSNVSFRSGTVQLAVGGESAAEETGPAEFLVGGITPQPAALSGGQRASFAAELTADGASLLWQTLERGESVLHAQYDLAFEHLPADLELHVWCDAERSHRTLARGDESDLSTLITRQLAGVRIETERPVSPEETAELTAHGHGVLLEVLGSVFFDPSPDGGPALKPWSPAMSARFDYLLAQSVPLPAEISIGGVLELPALDALAGRAERVDLEAGFFDVLQVGIFTTADFADAPIDKIKIAVDYDEVTDRGDRVERHEEYLLTEASPQATFRTELADPSKRSISYRAEVHYATSGVAPHVVERARTETTSIVLDVDTLGVVDLTGELGHAPPERISHATVELETLAGAHSHVAILDHESPSFRWLEATGTPDGGVRYRVTWSATDGARLETEWLEALSSHLRLDAPPALVRQGTIRLMSSGTFDGLAQIVVDLETLSEPSGQTAQFGFTAPGEQVDWRPALAAPGTPRYKYSMTLSFENGEIATLPEQESDRQVLAIYDSQRRDVEISARLLDLGGSLRLATLTLEGPDGRSRSFVFRAPEDRHVWSYRVPGETDAYRYQLTLIPSSGDRVSTPWLAAEDELLLLRQPPTE